PAIEGEAYSAEIGTASLKVTSGQLSDAVPPIEAEIRWADGSSTPVTMAPAEQDGGAGGRQSCTLRLALTFPVSSDHRGELTVVPAEPRALPPYPIPGQNTVMTVAVRPAASAGGGGPGGHGCGHGAHGRSGGPRSRTPESEPPPAPVLRYVAPPTPNAALH